MEQVNHLINGAETPSQHGETFLNENPATGETLGAVALGGAADVDAAVNSAQAAFYGEWSRLTPAQRGKLMYRVADLLEKHGEEIAQAETIDAGKPLANNRVIDVPFCADFWRFYAGAADKLRTPVAANEPGTFRYTVREPYGVIGAIAPWNFPLVMATIKISMALAAGNTVVMKMAEQTPLTTSLLGKILLEAGIPPGVVNVVHGDGKTGAALVEHPKVAKICFTGSSEVGRRIGEICARAQKPTLLEMGGKSANIVFADADIDQAINGVMQAGLSNNGQFCLAASRILVEESIAEKVIEGLVAKARSVRVGDPRDPATHCGPLVSKAQWERVNGYVQIGQHEGAELLTGGAKPTDLPDECRNGYFMQPTVFRRMTPEMRIWREEIFGPVVGVTTFKTEAEAIRLANDCAYGLGAFFWTQDLARTHRVSAAMDAGLVFVNMPQYMVPQVPVGIRKLSGTGQNFGLEALENYTKLKAVYVNYSGQIYPWLAD
jgi:acyl-CoA reductase-like NAD-dependent aldehyde dehydrogenase